jgi:GNAT superfamily N-acetyltransferase
VTGHDDRDATLDAIEAYYDAVPRDAATVEEHGPFRLFVSTGPWPYYARPSGPGVVADTADVERVAQRQRALSMPEQFEWTDDLHPDLAPVVAKAGLSISWVPLLVRLDPVSVPAVSADWSGRIASHDDPDLGRVRAVNDLVWHQGPKYVAEAGVAERDDLLRTYGRDEQAESYVRERIRTGVAVQGVVDHSCDGPMCVGVAQPVGAVAEIVGVGTLPAFRRRGLAGLLVTTLSDEVERRGVRTVFLTAGDDAAARVYERVGFRRIATGCIATRG